MMTELLWCCTGFVKEERKKGRKDGGKEVKRELCLVFGVGDSVSCHGFVLLIP